MIVCFQFVQLGTKKLKGLIFKLLFYPIFISMHIHINEGMQKIQSIWIYSMHNYGQFELLSDKIFNIYQDGSFTTTSGGTVKCQQLYFFYQVLQNKFVHNLRIGDTLKTRTTIQSEKPGEHVLSTLENYQIDTCLPISLYLRHGFGSESEQPDRNSVNQKVLKISPSFRKNDFIFFQFQWGMGFRPKSLKIPFFILFLPFP